MKSDIKLDVYLVTDRELSRGRSIDEIVTAAVKGGATIVQLREKFASTRDFIQTAERLKMILKPYNVPLIINDRVDVALAVDADGVHIGQDDMPYDIARRLLGPHKIIGLSVESIRDARDAEALDVDYLGVSPIYFTPTKTDLKRQLGLAGLHKIRSFSRHRLVAIGGLNVSNAAEAIQSGADGVAVVSAICSADNPQAAASELATIVKKIKQVMP
ncbi:thiamine phosphate synthase [candidate division KSB1 bacterium]|nr:thiamine phosphate synthase [candidate division KSB1 bacterium]RQW05614.1 MAG: thiamine phosphate synthase [candidate division KSB1 bacterium]